MINSDKLKIEVSLWSIKWATARAGNPKTTGLSSHVPESLSQLASCPSGSGHDCFLKGIVVFIDWKVNKIIREQLLRYNFINVVSSNSLMHCFERYKENGMLPENCQCVDDIPLSFEYWMSFQTNYLQLKTIYKQRKTHKRQEWQVFCDAIEKLPESHLITGVYE